MKVKKFKKGIDKIQEVLAGTHEILNDDMEKYVKTLEKAKDLAQENKKLKKQIEELESQLDYALSEEENEIDL